MNVSIYISYNLFYFISFHIPLIQSIQRGDPRTQIIELLRKRFLITSRDLKGLFFQIIFPALQIIVILAMLNILVSQPHRAIKINASIFTFRPDVLSGGIIDKKSIVKDFSAERMNMHRFVCDRR